MERPEARFAALVTPDDAVVCRAPGQAEHRVAMADLGAVWVATNDGGPWGADVWWVLEDRSGRQRVSFPQLASGEGAVIARLQQLPGFAVRGMNSVANARFMCWPTPEPL